MELELLLFGVTKDIIGPSPYSYKLITGTTANDLIESLIEKYPSLANLNSLAVAVNGEYASRQTQLKTGDEIALIPPVSGG